MRRVIVKARIVRLTVGSRAADAHVRYLQRDGTSQDGERGGFYGPETDEANGKAFVERGREDRHHFRFIVAPEDGRELSDLRAFTRELMGQMEKDLCTRLDWIAVDHWNTGHPHSHVLVNGRDDTGKDLIIAQDYITDGMRLRAQDLVTLELGPESELELRTKLDAQITAERFTGIDRVMLREAKDRVLDLRPEAGQVRVSFDRTLRIGRLKALERYGLAREGEPGVWTLSSELEPTMRALGKRGDIIEAINRALAGRGEERAVESLDLYGEQTATPIVGRVIDKHLSDELGDRVGMVIDGVDGRVHHVALGDTASAAETPIGSIVEVAPTPPSRPADHNIARMTYDGVYSPSLHRQEARITNVRVPGGEYDAYVEAHVRRLEALRRAGIVKRVDSDKWIIPRDFEARAAAYDAAKGRQASLRVLSVFDLDRQVTSDGATWLDRQLVGRARGSLARNGFGAEVRRALDQRVDELTRHGHARQAADGKWEIRTNLLGTLRRQEIERVGHELAAENGRTFRQVRDGEAVRGTLIGSTQLASGRFAMIDDRLGFSLVPWRSVLENQIGHQVRGIMRGAEISWELGRSIGLSIGI
jgi:type IV secretory pathway VirD2 relaxase